MKKHICLMLAMLGFVAGCVAADLVVNKNCEVKNCKGVMISSGRPRMNHNPPLIPHTCNVCGAKKDFTNSYPMTVKR